MAATGQQLQNFGMRRWHLGFWGFGIDTDFQFVGSVLRQLFTRIVCQLFSPLLLFFSFPSNSQLLSPFHIPPCCLDRFDIFSPPSLGTGFWLDGFGSMRDG